MGDPISQGFIVELYQQMGDRVDGGHARVRQSLNEMKADMKSGFAEVTQTQQQINRRIGRHSERLSLIEQAREIEAQQLKTAEQRANDRSILAATWTSIVITVAMFVIKALWDHRNFLLGLLYHWR